MTTQKVRINQGRLFSEGIRWITTLVILAGMYLSLTYLSEMSAILTCLGLSIVIPPLWSSHYLLEYNPESEVCYQILVIAGRQRKKAIGEGKVEGLYLTELSKNQMTSMRGHLRIKQVRKYFAYLRLEYQSEYYLFSAADSEDLIRRITPIHKKLQCPLQDEISIR